MDTNLLIDIIKSMSQHSKATSSLSIAIQEWGPIVSPFIATLVIYLQLRNQQIKSDMAREATKSTLDTIHVAVNSAKSEADRVQAASVAGAAILVDDKMKLASKNAELEERVRGLELAIAKSQGATDVKPTPP